MIEFHIQEEPLEMEYPEKPKRKFMEKETELFFLKKENLRSELFQIVLYVLFSFEIDEILSLFRNFMYKYLRKRSLLITFQDFCKFMNQIEKSLGSFQTIKVLKLINPAMYSRFNSLELLFGNPQERRPGSKLGSFVLKGYFEYFKYKMNPENEKLYGFKKKDKANCLWSSEKRLEEPDVQSQSRESRKNIEINIVMDPSESNNQISPNNEQTHNRIRAFQNSNNNMRRISNKNSPSNHFFKRTSNLSRHQSKTRSMIHENFGSSEKNLEFGIYTDETDSDSDSGDSRSGKSSPHLLNSIKNIKGKSFIRPSSKVFDHSPFSKHESYIEPIIEDNLEDVLPTQMETTPRKKPKIKLESAFGEEYLDILKSLPFLLVYFFLDLTLSATELKRQFESQHIFQNRQQMMAAVCLSAQVVLSKSKMEDTMTLVDLENLLFVYKNTFAPNITETQTKLILDDFKNQQKNISAHRLSVKYVLEHLTCLLGYIDSNNAIEKKIKSIHKRVKKTGKENIFRFGNDRRRDEDDRNMNSMNRQTRQLMDVMDDDELIVDHLQANSIHQNLIWRLSHYLYHKKVFWITYEIRKNLLIFLNFKTNKIKEIKLKKVFHALADGLATIFPHSHEFIIFKVIIL